MGNFFRDDRSSGSSGGWRDKKPAMHQTVCSECGAECEVPFKPNGRKPVFCRACFRKDEFDAGRPAGRDFEKPRFEKPRGGGDQYKAQFEMLNFKMDMILKTLHQMGDGKAPSAEPKLIKEKRKKNIEKK